MRVLRVFPRRTSYTPTDDLAFVGDPPLWRPEADRVDVSCTFSWDRPEAERLAGAWSKHYPFVALGGPAYAARPGHFWPGLYVKQGITFTTRGCGNRCPFCLVPEREGRLVELDPVPEGHIVQDNNLLQATKAHRERVYAMLRRQPKAAIFAGGLQPSLVTDEIAAELAGIRIRAVFLAADTWESLGPLAEAVRRLEWLSRRQLRCYALCAYGDDTPHLAEERLEAIWQAGCLPFVQLYQSPDQWRDYSPEWRALQRKWSRPAAMFAAHRQEAV